MDGSRIARARNLRRDATDAERRLWSALRNHHLSGYRFRRQYPIGPFFVDFACTKERVIVEADGGQHSDSKTDPGRTAWLESRGWRILRFWNNEILRNPEGVIDVILRELRSDNPHPATISWRPPSPAVRERG
ncbi:MAG TPA: endonuclease domain-containing protein [Stellaceae bacterium]|nr:endonuclease domain-containing protein [Stellaceae bacterium]